MNPLTRPRIDTLIETGVRAIDCLLPLGRGQRMGIFAGSGVGKSTLLGMLARDVKADVNVIALIGERGREVLEFIEKHLGTEGLKRSVLIVATSDQPALFRARAAYAATALAEYFRAEGKQVLLMMDSVTRFAMARREIGLAAGEPPTARGYTPSVFSEIPALCERCGSADSGGSITALYTVLVEGDDFNEPISDIVRGTLDGHIMLSRDLAHEGHFPAIDVLQSISRLANDLVDDEGKETMRAAIELLAVYERNRQMVDMGAYKIGSNPAVDRAIQLYPAIRKVLQQSILESTQRVDAMGRLRAALAGGTA
jgi:flagellum-specific ATP synthase